MAFMYIHLITKLIKITVKLMVQYFFRDNFCVCKFNGCDENEGVTIIPMRGLAQKMIEGL